MNLSSAWVTRLECPKGVKDEVKQARRAKRVAEGHQLEIGAQRAPRFLVIIKVQNPSGLPPGFILTEEILNAEKPNLPPPATIHYTEKHVSEK